MSFLRPRAAPRRAAPTRPSERLCYLTIRYDHFEAGQRYVLEGRSIAFTPGARLYNAKREIVAEDREANCLM